MTPIARPCLRQIHPTDLHLIWPLFQAVIQAGDTYALSPDTTMEEARASIPGA